MSETTNKSQSPRRRSRSRSKGRLDNKPIRVWCPGSYDFLHYGQANFLRRVKREMSIPFSNVQLVAGIYSDRDLIAKGRQPVFTVHERFDMVRANKWVDDVVKDAPMELSKKVLKEYCCDYAFYLGQDELFLLGDPNNGDIDELMDCGLLKKISCSRDDYGGISSCDIINRILLLEPRDENNNTISGKNWNPKRLTFPDSLSCKELLRFATGSTPKPTDKIVYVDGSFDVLHPGHITLLEKAHSLGDFLYVGVHSDESISKYAGVDFPVMQWNERVMALLSCKYVSEIIIDAPTEINESLLDAFSINCVVPSVNDYERLQTESDEADGNVISDRYAVAKQRGIFHEMALDNLIDKTANLTVSGIFKRVHDNWNEYSYAAVTVGEGIPGTGLGKLKTVTDRQQGDGFPNDEGERMSVLETLCK